MKRIIKTLLQRINKQPWTHKRNKNPVLKVIIQSIRKRFFKKLLKSKLKLERRFTNVQETLDSKIFSYVVLFSGLLHHVGCPGQRNEVLVVWCFDVLQNPLLVFRHETLLLSCCRICGGGLLVVDCWWWIVGGGLLVVDCWWWIAGGGLLVVDCWWFFCWFLWDFFIDRVIVRSCVAIGFIVSKVKIKHNRVP